MKLNPNQELLWSHLERSRDIAPVGLRQKGYHYANLYDFVLQEGRFFEPSPLPSGIRRRQKGHCYHSAFMTQAEHRLHYVEGYALAHGNAWAHGWNVTDDGAVVDTSWGTADAYIGVVIPIEAVFKVMRQRKNTVNSVLDNWEKGFPLLKKK